MNATHFVFVRAMNTGGRRLTNDQQLAPFRTSGFIQVAAYQAAGNIVIRSDQPVRSAEFDPLLASAYGFEAPTFVRTVAQLRVVVDSQPFTSEQVAVTAGRIQVAFMTDAPNADAIADVMAAVPDEDSVVVSGSEWYWLPAEGISGSSLPVNAIERAVGPMTIRTLGTLQRMLDKFS